MKLVTPLYALTWMAIAALPVALLWIVASGGLPDAAQEAGRRLFVAEPLSDARMVWAFAVGLLPWVATMVVLLHVQALLSLFRRGQALTHAAARTIRSAGVWLALVALLRVLSYSAQSLIFTGANPPGTRSLVLALDFNHLALFLAGGLLVVIGHAMAEATEAAEDARGFV